MIWNMKSRSNQLFPVLFYLCLASFLAFYLKGIDFSKFHEATFIWIYVVIASFIGIATRYWQVFIWFVLLSGLGATNLGNSAGELIYVYAKSWLGRYIPGTAPWILGKIYFASRHGISKNKLAVSSLLEGSLQVSVTLALAFVMLIFDTRLDVITFHVKLLMTIVIFASMIAIWPPIFNSIISIAYKFLKRKNLANEHLVSGRIISRGVALYAVGAILNGLSLFFICKAVSPTLSYHDLIFVMGAGNLAGAVGMLAIFVPSGLGIREGISLILLSVIMPRELALIVTVAWRIWGVVIDLIFFVASRSIKQLAGKAT